MIEVMIAVVVLAVGLLALGALQASLTRNSADAKVRSRVSSMLTTRMDELRGSGYGNAALNAGKVDFSCSNGNPAWLCAAQTQANVGSLQVTQTTTRYWSERDAGAFSTGATQVANGPEFKRVVLEATWTAMDSSDPRKVTMSSDISSVALSDSLLPSAPTLATVASSNPIVREDNPASAGVIPIAIGGGDATAASNPRPEVIGKNNNATAVGTRFNVLTYEGLTGAAVIQRRVENAVVSCSCQYGAGGDNLPEIYRTAQWPAIWTGEKYEVYKPAMPAAAPGAAVRAGPTPNVDQSPLCQECCRDHHDSGAAGEAKFDPERTAVTGESSGTEKYSRSNAGVFSIAAAVSGNKYVNVCRVIRVDGWWRTASDTYAKHVTQLKTTAVAGVAAKSGAPDETGATTYQNFVKGYLAGYDGTASTIANATDGGQINGTTININAPAPVDERYLHARGLYVDYLGAKAKERIAQARTPANCPSGDLTECSLPYLPFTTINTTELAYWEPQVSGASNSSILTVATGSSLILDPLAPTRGRTNAKAGVVNGSEADAASIITRSNAGLADALGVDPADSSASGTDRQRFRVSSGSTGGGGTGEPFSVRLVGLPQTSDNNAANDPAVVWANSSGTANCAATLSSNGDKDPNDYACSTFGTLGISSTVTVGNYFTTSTAQNTSLTCSGFTDNSYKVPRLVNYRISQAVVNGVAASSITPSNDNTGSETSAVVFGAIPANGLVQLTFVDEGNGAWATIKTCQLSSNGKKIDSVTWNESWAQ